MKSAMKSMQTEATLRVKRGRPPGSAIGSMTERIEVRMTTTQREKLKALGGAQWLRDQITAAKV